MHRSLAFRKILNFSETEKLHQEEDAYHALFRQARLKMRERWDEVRQPVEKVAGMSEDEICQTEIA
jgi:hypothetical protein